MQLDDTTFLHRFARRELGPETFDHRGSVEQALEQRLIALNREIAQLHAQRRLVLGLLGGNHPAERNGTVGVDQWVRMLEEAGIDEAGRHRWHQAFERDAPAAHHQFLASLGLDEERIAEIRRLASP
ncbi:MerR family transcriptional regulator [Endothiovibrio diazotrophicus]